MKKKVSVLIISVVFLLVGYTIAEEVSFTFETCGVGYTGVNEGNFPLAPACEGYRGFLSEISEAIGVPLFYFFLSFFIVSIALLFISDNIFTKWLKFALGYTIFAWSIIIITPVNSGGWIPRTPNREQVSIWMSSLFLIISLVLIIIWKIKERKSLK